MITAEVHTMDRRYIDFYILELILNPDANLNGCDYAFLNYILKKIEPFSSI